MENWIIWLIFAGIFCALLVLHVAAGSKKPFRRALGSALNGLVALVLVNITGGFTGSNPPGEPAVLGSVRRLGDSRSHDAAAVKSYLGLRLF